jgi:hypothetical protein
VATFLLSGGSPVLISLFFGLLVCALLLMVVRRPKTTVVDRVQKFVRQSPGRLSARGVDGAAGSASQPLQRTGWWAELERDLELARMTVTARQVAGMALGAPFSSLSSRWCSSAAPRALRVHDAVYCPRSGEAEAEGRPAGIRRAVPRQPAGACLGASAPAIASTGRSAWSSTTSTNPPDRNWRG